MRRSRFCGNDADAGSTAIEAAADGSATFELYNNSFFDHESEGTVVNIVGTGGEAIVRNNTWSQGALGTLLRVADLDDMAVHNNVFRGGSTAFDIGENVEYDYNLYWDQDTDATREDGSHALHEDPLLTSYVEGTCDESLALLASNSPAIDAGDPSWLDPDGTRSDIGAYGGTYADDEGYGPEGTAQILDEDQESDQIVLASGGCLFGGSQAWMLPLPLLWGLRRRKREQVEVADPQRG